MVVQKKQKEEKIDKKGYELISKLTLQSTSKTAYKIREDKICLIVEEYSFNLNAPLSKET